MFKLMVVDDENVIRVGLRTIIDWNRYGFSLCGEASNGREGLAKAETIKPDLIIADIRMPGLDGLEMMEQLKQRGICSKVMILTGYSEFNYARKAVELGAEAYILKPVDEAELIEKVQHVSKKLEEEQKRNQITKISEPIARSKAVRDMVRGEGAERAVQVLNSCFGFGLPWRKYQVILMSVQTTGNVPKNIKGKIEDEISGFLDEAQYGYVFDDDENIGMLVKDYCFSERRMLPLRKLNKKIREQYPVNSFMAVGKSVDRQEQLHESYRNASKLLENSFALSSDNMISNEQVYPDPKDIAGEKTDLEQTGEKLYAAIELNQTEYINNLLELLRKTVVRETTDEKQIKIIYVNLIITVFQKLSKSYGNIVKEVSDKTDFVKEIFGKCDLQELHGYIKFILFSVSDKITFNGLEGIINKILGYIEQNLEKNIKLAALSEMYGYNSTYLGKCFTRQMGMSFNTYLDKVRIERAKVLLQDGCKVCDVAMKVGYCDKDYFYMKFKKYTGKSPKSMKVQKGLDIV